MLTETIALSLQSGDIIYCSAGFLGYTFFKVIHREEKGVILQACTETGKLVKIIKTFFLRDKKANASLVWKKVTSIS
jgi:hypothetical protein